MELVTEMKNYADACERLISIIATNRQLTEVEARTIDFYSKEVLAKIASRLPNPN
jgi:hypothetical protein